MIRYVTRWAVTTGIREVDGEYTDDGKYFAAHGYGYRVFVTADEAFESLEKAVAQAKKMAAHRACNLRKQADKLSDPKWQPKVVRK